jgi:hypothetical protein
LLVQPFSPPPPPPRPVHCITGALHKLSRAAQGQTFRRPQAFAHSARAVFATLRGPGNAKKGAVKRPPRPRKRTTRSTFHDGECYGRANAPSGPGQSQQAHVVQQRREEAHLAPTASTPRRPRCTRDRRALMRQKPFCPSSCYSDCSCQRERERACVVCSSSECSGRN